MRVDVKVTPIWLDGDYGQNIDGIAVKCTRCRHCVEVYGDSTASVRRGCVMLRDECPRGENNFYQHCKKTLATG